MVSDVLGFVPAGRVSSSSTPDDNTVGREEYQFCELSHYSFLIFGQKGGQRHSNHATCCSISGWPFRPLFRFMTSLLWTLLHDFARIWNTGDLSER